MKWYVRCLEHYADFKGRARRKEFWMFVLINFLVYVILGTALMVVAPGGLRVFLLYIYLAYSVFTIVPGLAVGVRRLHDIGRSGWNYLLFLIPIVGQILLLVWFCLPGEKGFNEWGDNPKYGLDFDEESETEMPGNKQGIIQIDDFEQFADSLEESGYPVSGKKKDSLYVNYKGTKLAVYKTKSAYRVAPKEPWVLLLLIIAYFLVAIFIGEKTGHSDLFAQYGVIITLIVALVLSFIIYFFITAIRNLIKKKYVKHFCEEMQEQ